MPIELYVRLSLMMFLQFAIWGAWSPVLASYLFGSLKFTGKQTAWIYATLWLACIVSPFIGGQIADRWFPSQYFLAIAHLLGAVLLFIAARKTKFLSLFIVLGLYCLLYAPTIALANSIMFSNIPDTESQSGTIRVWGTIGWIAAGLLLALWRNTGKLKIKGSDALSLAAFFSLIMSVFCFLLPNTPPPATPSSPWAFIDAFKLLNDYNFLTFLIISFVVTTALQFYYVPTALFLEDLGIKSKNVSAVMTIAQSAEIITMALALAYLLPKIGYRWTLVIGVLAWPLRYIIFSLMRPLWLVVSSLSLHGLGYTLFFFVGQMYVDKVAPDDIKASAQALIVITTLGFGNFLGTQITGVVMDHFRANEKFRWRPIFLFPCAITIACAIAFLVLFKG